MLNAYSSGAGGSVSLKVGVLRGGGFIDASGDDQNRCSIAFGRGSGGGGRIGIEADTLDGFDPDTQARAWGGTQFQCGSPEGYGAPGTILVKLPGDTYGRLRIDNGTASDGSSRQGPGTELPRLGEGSVVGLSPVGVDAWLESEQPFRPRWLGANVMLLGASGEELGSFQVADIDTGGRASRRSRCGIRGSNLSGRVPLRFGPPCRRLPARLRSGAEAGAGPFGRGRDRGRHGRGVRGRPNRSHREASSDGHPSVRGRRTPDRRGGRPAGRERRRVPGCDGAHRSRRGRRKQGRREPWRAREALGAPGADRIYDGVYQPRLAGAGGAGSGGEPEEGSSTWRSENLVLSKGVSPRSRVFLRRVQRPGGSWWHDPGSCRNDLGTRPNRCVRRFRGCLLSRWSVRPWRRRKG